MDVHIKKRKRFIKALIFLASIIGAIVLIRFTPVKDYLTAEALTTFLENVGVWAPAVYILVYAVGVCLFLPGTLLTGLGAAIFGAYWGSVYVLIAAMLGASGAFLIGRTLAREFVIVPCRAINSAALLLRSANDKHPRGLANSSDQVGRNYMYHLLGFMVAVAKRPNPTVFEKTLGLNDF